MFCATFERRRLRPNEDPSLLLWELEDLLTKADPDLSEEAKQALLSRQFMKSLPEDLRLRLLEHNPTPSLSDMRDFVRRYRAVHRDDGSSPVCAIQDQKTPSVHADGDLAASVRSLSAAVAALSVQQQELKAAMKQQHPQHNPQQ